MARSGGVQCMRSEDTSAATSTSSAADATVKLAIKRRSAGAGHGAQGHNSSIRVGKGVGLIHHEKSAPTVQAAGGGHTVSNQLGLGERSDAEHRRRQE